MWLWIPSVSMTVEAWERWISIIGGAAQELRFLAFIGTFTHYIMTYQRKLILCYIVVRITCGRRRYSHTVHYHQKQMMCNLMFCWTPLSWTICQLLWVVPATLHDGSSWRMRFSWTPPPLPEVSGTCQRSPSNSSQGVNLAAEMCLVRRRAIKLDGVTLDSTLSFVIDVAVCCCLYST